MGAEYFCIIIGDSYRAFVQQERQDRIMLMCCIMNLEWSALSMNPIPQGTGEQKRNEDAVLIANWSLLFSDRSLF